MSKRKHAARRSWRGPLRAGAAALCLAAVTGCAGDVGAEPGRQLAEKLCARCHAIGPTGDSPMKEAPPFRTFPEKWPLEDLEEALAEGIVVGHEAMPEFELTAQQIDDLLGYLATLKK